MQPRVCPFQNCIKRNEIWTVCLSMRFELIALLLDCMKQLVPHLTPLIPMTHQTPEIV